MYSQKYNILKWNYDPQWNLKYLFRTYYLAIYVLNYSPVNR